MKNPRLRKYLERKDAKTSQDFRDFPGGDADPDIINPKNETEKKTAALDVKDGEKMLNPPSRKKKNDADQDNGSGGAFEATEEVKS